MTAVGLLLALTVIFGAGSGLTRLLGGAARTFPRTELIALSWLFGAGYVSLALWLLGLALSGWSLVTTIALGAAGIWTAEKCRGRLRAATPSGPPCRLTFIDGALIAILFAQAVFIIWWTPRLALGWDGLMIWEFKARLAFANGGALPAAYFTDATRAWSHPNYPLGLPGLETWLQLCLGRVDQAWLRLCGPLYYCAGAALIVTGTQRFGGTQRTGLAAAVAFFFVPYFFGGMWGVFAGYADLPLGVLFLAALIYLPGCRETPGDAALCAALSTLLIWEKREGRLLWIALIFLAACALLPRGRWRTCLAVALPGAALLLGFETWLRLHHTLEEAIYLPATLANLQTHAYRIVPVLKHLLRELANLESWGLLWPGVAIALIAHALRGEPARALRFTAALLLPLAAYLFAFVLTSWNDFEWQMDVALPRLLLHFAPAGLLIIALAVPSHPFSSFSSSSSHPSK